MAVRWTASFLTVAPAAAEVADPTGGGDRGQSDLITHERIPDMEYAHSNVNAFRRCVPDALDFDPADVADLRGAGRAAL